MSLKPFTYPFPETRFFHTGYNVYKFKIRYGSSIRKEERKNKDVNIQELEDSVRVVLGNLDSLQPFTTEHFIVFPYKSKWERVSHLRFLQGDVSLVPYPFVFTLYVEMKRYQENLSPGSEVGDIREGQMAPSVQQINAPPPEEPAEQGAMGFFGFLSSLFPFRFLFWKTHH
ncbi:membrane-anchored junction protein [Rhynchocyon petersi]